MTELVDGWRDAPLAQIVEFRNRERIPLSAAQRETRRGPYPYWGANGPFDSLDAFLFEGPNVLVAEDGSIVVRPDGRGTVHWADGRYWVNNHAHVLNVQAGHNLRWLYYALTCARVRNHVSGSAQPKLSMGSLKQLRLRVPPPKEQARIAWVLSALDGMIAVEERVRESALAVLEALLEDAMRRAIPGRNESLASIADFVNGGAFTRGASGAGRPVLRIRELNARAVDENTVRSEREVADRHIARNGNLLFSWSGTLDTFRWYGEESIINQHIFKVLPRTRPLWEVELWIDHHMKRFRRIAADKAVTMGHIRRGDLAEAKVLTFAPEDASRLRTVGDALDARRDQARRTQRRATEVRDILLPKLIFGEIRVPTTSDETEAVETVIGQAPPDK